MDRPATNKQSPHPGSGYSEHADDGPQFNKDQTTTAITEALNEGDEDKDMDISRFQQVQEAFPENFEQFL